MNELLTPVKSKERIIALDVLRGFALFGILMVNMKWFHTPVASLISPHELWSSAPDKAVDFVVKFLFEGKFYLLFSMLFGYGFYLFSQKSSLNTQQVKKIYAMRLLGLLIIGAIHVVFFWPGDILVFYALLGFLLMLFWKKKTKKLIRWAVFFISVPVVFMGLATLLTMLPEAAEEMQQSMIERNKMMLNMVEKALMVYPEGRFLELIQMRIEEYTLSLGGILFFHVNILAMFLIGAWAGRKKLLVNIDQNITFFRKLMIIGLSIGLPANLFIAIASLHADVFAPGVISFWVTFATALGSPAFTFGYIGMWVLLLHYGYIHKLSEWLSSVGRMALTNYLMHSVLAVFVFQSYGLGLYGKVSTWQGASAVLFVFILQIVFSRYWLKKFRFGPAEWVWRSFTYLKWQRLKRSPDF